MKTVFNYVIAGVFVVTLFIGVIRGAGHTLRMSELIKLLSGA